MSFDGSVFVASGAIVSFFPDSAREDRRFIKEIVELSWRTRYVTKKSEIVKMSFESF